MCFFRTFKKSTAPYKVHNMGLRYIKVERSHLRGFCHYPHRSVDTGHHRCKTTEYKSTDHPLPPLLNVMYCVRVFLWTVKIFLAQN